MKVLEPVISNSAPFEVQESTIIFFNSDISKLDKVKYGDFACFYIEDGVKKSLTSDIDGYKDIKKEHFIVGKNVILKKRFNNPFKERLYKYNILKDSSFIYR